MTLPSFNIPGIRNNIPPELVSSADFLSYLGVSIEEMRKIWWYRGRMYHQFEVSKKNGKKRTIHAPDKRLKYLQRRIAPLLDQIYSVRNPVHGFVKDRSVKTNALAHLGKRFVLNIDLKDYFPSITEVRVSRLLESINVDTGVAALIARICCLHNQLPQGAPTSPVLSNMICFRLDKELLALAKGARCIYTRYADDITFSSHQPIALLFEGSIPSPGRIQPEQLIKPLHTLISGNGFSINPDKAHYADKHSRRVVTGLKVNELLNLDRRYVRNIRAALYSVERLGIDAAQKKFENHHGGTSEIGAHLQGKISWLRHIRGQSDPVFRAIAVRYNASFADHSFQIMPSPDEILDRAVWVVEHFEGDMAQGSAFFLKDVGLVTAAHCVSGASVVEVYHPSKPSNRFKSTVAKCDEHRDLAILEHGIPNTEYFELERTNHHIAVGDDMIAVGYPNFGPGDSLNIRDGKVSSLPVKSGVHLVEVTQKLSQGMSGGPLLWTDNSVTGVVHKGGPGEGRDFAIHVEMLNDWLAE